LKSKFVPMGFADIAMAGENAVLDPDNVKPSQLSIHALKEKATDVDGVMVENQELSSVVHYVRNKYTRAKDVRQADEKRWLECYRNFRGLYGPDVQFTEREKSRAFIKITKTKVLAAYGKVSSVLFSTKKFPIGVEETPVPQGVLESVYFDSKEDEAEKGNEQAAKMPGTITRKGVFDTIESKLGPYTDTLAKLPTDVKLREGSGKTPSSQTFEPAKEAARLMEMKMHDQLEEADASKHLRAVIHEMCLFGTGIWKGPFARDKEYPKWDESGTYTPQFLTIPDLGHVSIWNCYPDPDARTKDECEYWIERYRMTKSQMRQLKKRPYFRSQSIEAAIKDGANYNEEYWELFLDDNKMRTGNGVDRFEVLEYWGTIDRETAEMEGLEIPEELEEADDLQVNIWVCNGQLLRLVLNPFTPARIPYYAVPYEINPYSIFGIGVAENMLDTQLVMNGFFRLAIDNAALSSNIILEVDETNMVPGQDMTLYPGKIFRRQAGAPGQAIFATKFPNVTNECMMLFDKARQLSDEATGMPSYAHGISGIQSTGRTASGMSMLMEAADESIKSVISNVDDYLLIPFGQALYAFNMQFNFDKNIKGDLTVVARGTESLMRNEIRSQKLLQFLQITSNQLDAPFIKRDYILRELAKSLDLDPEKIVNDPREAGIQAENLKKLKQAMGADEASMGGAPTPPGNPAGAPSVSDPTQTGGGNVAPGASPSPGAEGFSGATPPNIGQGAPA
jgi:hypothetical protein